MKFCLVFLVLIPFLSFSQSDTTINYTDDQGFKQGYWVFTGLSDPAKGYPENGIIYEGSYLNNRMHGYWKFYYQNGIDIKLEGEFDQGRPGGNYIKYYENGCIMEIGTISRGQNINVIEKYNEEGVLIEEKNFNSDGRLDGVQRDYYENGNIQFVYTSENGKTVGKATRYYENGDVRTELEYDFFGNVLSLKSY